ncbi:pollen-specific leucine-rich repeat extensin-like protein 3 [Helianthus annuus]|uniref:pollen-specific leucine-rich repeat extensin-like protein 3 n=1 Tax=Helianthus annuus TaxID=4232 RepID=UPI000B8F6B85|nr:pollen-specific leucine-rich repeat extensin-like protein 3 [Helianthus annuus]
MPSSSDTGVSDTLDPMAIVSDDEILPESEVHTSDTTSTDEDDFQPFALPDDAPLADGPFDGDLPLIPIPAPIPLTAFPLEDLPLDALPDDDIDLFIEGPPEGDQDGGAPMEDDIPVDDPVVPIVEVPAADAVVLPPAEALMGEAPSDSSGPDSFESVASASIHDQGVQHYSPDADSDMAMSVAPIVPHDVDPDPEVEFVPSDPAPADPELELAPEPDHVDAPAVVPPVPDVPIVDAPVIAPPVVDHAPFATHIDPRYVDTLNGWIEDVDDYPPFVVPVTPTAAPVFAPLDVPQFHPHISDVHRTDLPITFLQDIPPPHPGEGPSTQQPDHMPPMTATLPPMPSFTPAAHTISPFAPLGEPFLWTSPHVMPLSDPYHPYHVGYTTDDILISLQLQQDALSRRVQELERTPCPPPCYCQSPFATPPAPLSLPPDSDVRFLTPEQQIAYLLRVIHALEEDWVRLRRLIFFPPPPPPPPSA